MTTLLWALSIALVLAGIISTILPAVPGPALVFLGLLMAAWIDGFAKVGVPTLIILGLLVLVSYGVDFLATLFGVRKAGASTLSIIGAAVGGIVGLFFGLPGVLIGPFAGAALGEYLARRNLGQAGRAAVGSWLGFILGAAAKLALAFVMIGTFVVSYFFL